MRKLKLADPIRFSLSGHFGENNVGDDLLLISLIRGIRARFEKCNIIILTASKKNTEKLLVREGVSLDLLTMVYSGRWGIFEPDKGSFGTLSWILQTIWFIFRSNLLLIGPGTIIKDTTKRFFLLFWLSKAFVANLLKTPYAFIAIGVGDLRRRSSKYLIRIFANRAVFISTRDKESADALFKLGIDKSKIISLSDLSFIETNSICIHND